MLQRVAVCCNGNFERDVHEQDALAPVLQCFAVSGSVLQYNFTCCNVLQWVFFAAMRSHKMPSRLCCSVLQSVAVCCSVLQCVAMRMLITMCSRKMHSPVMQFVAQCGKVLQYDLTCCNVLQWEDLNTISSHKMHPRLCCSVLHSVAACCSEFFDHDVCSRKMLEPAVQYVAICCSVLQFVAVCCSAMQCVAELHSEIFEPDAEGPGANSVYHTHVAFFNKYTPNLQVIIWPFQEIMAKYTERGAEWIHMRMCVNKKGPRFKGRSYTYISLSRDLDRHLGLMINASKETFTGT